MSEKPLAYDAYQELAPHYARLIDTKPHNAYYERPAMVAMWPELAGKKVLDAGCGPGVYAELLLARGARVVSVDISERMLEQARVRLGHDADLRLVDLTRPLVMFMDAEFDMVNAPLCLDYIEDWSALFREFHRVLRPGGKLQFSCAHPLSMPSTSRQKIISQWNAVVGIWRGFGPAVSVPAYRRSLQQVLMPLVESNFALDKIVEPLPTDEFRGQTQGIIMNCRADPPFGASKRRGTAELEQSQIQRAKLMMNWRESRELCWGASCASTIPRKRKITTHSSVTLSLRLNRPTWLIFRRLAHWWLVNPCSTSARVLARSAKY